MRYTRWGPTGHWIYGLVADFISGRGPNFLPWGLSFPYITMLDTKQIHSKFLTFTWILFLYFDPTYMFSLSHMPWYSQRLSNTVSWKVLVPRGFGESQNSVSEIHVLPSKYLAILRGQISMQNKQIKNHSFVFLFSAQHTCEDQKKKKS